MSVVRHVCISHANCFDGMAAAWVDAVWVNSLHKGDTLMDRETYFLNYGDPFPDLPAPPYPGAFTYEIFILDFSFPEQVLRDVLHRFEVSGFCLVDHHPGSKELLASLHAYYTEQIQPAREAWGQEFVFGGVFSEEHSGAMLAWKLFFGDVEPPDLIRYVDDHDRWVFKLPQTKHFNAALGTLGLDLRSWLDFFGDDITKVKTTSKAQELLDATEGVYTLKQELVRWVIDNTARQIPLFKDSFPSFIEESEYLAWVINCPKPLMSEAVELLYQEKGVPFALGYYDLPGDGGRKFSIRSTKELDIRPLASYFGGQGHPNAAGFQVGRWHRLAKI